MAARRLIIVLVVLFTISIAAAAVAPQRDNLVDSDDETSSTATTAPKPPTPSGGSSTELIEASAEDPQTIRAGVGDQVELIVSTDVALQVELPDLGLLEEATPDAPARFNILLREEGDLAITDADNGEVIGRLLVGEAEDPEPGGAGQDDPSQPGSGGSEPNSVLS